MNAQVTTPLVSSALRSVISYSPISRDHGKHEVSHLNDDVLAIGVITCVSAGRAHAFPTPICSIPPDHAGGERRSSRREADVRSVVKEHGVMYHSSQERSRAEGQGQEEGRRRIVRQGESRAYSGTRHGFITRCKIFGWRLSRSTKCVFCNQELTPVGKHNFTCTTQNCVWRIR